MQFETPLRLRYKGVDYADFSFIDIGEEEAGPKITYELELVNTSDKYTIEKIQFMTNMPAEAYDVDYPQRVDAADKAPMILTLDTGVLFASDDSRLFDADTKKHKIQLALDHECTRTYSKS